LPFVGTVRPNVEILSSGVGKKSNKNLKGNVLLTDKESRW